MSLIRPDSFYNFRACSRSNQSSTPPSVWSGYPGPIWTRKKTLSSSVMTRVTWTSWFSRAKISPWRTARATPNATQGTTSSTPTNSQRKYRQISNIRRTLVGNNIVDHSDVDGASPVGAAPTTSSFSTGNASCITDPLWKEATVTASSLQWRHNVRDSVSNHQPRDCLLKRLFRRRSKKTSKLRVTGLCAGNSPVTGEFPAKMASNVENVSIWWRHHVPSRRGDAVEPWHFYFC